MDTRTRDNSFLPGYIRQEDFMPATPFDKGGAFQDLRIVMPDNKQLDFGSEAHRRDASSYVWRLAPYLGDGWSTAYADYASPSLMSHLQAELDRGVYGEGTRDPDPVTGDVGASTAPSFGLNSYFLGGDSYHPGICGCNEDYMDVRMADVAPRYDWSSVGFRLAARRLSEVPNASKIIVFAGCAWIDGDWGYVDDPNGVQHVPDTSGAEIRFGHGVVMPPYADILNELQPYCHKLWGYDPVDSLSGRNALVLRPPSASFWSAGVPYGRWGAFMIPTSALDGSVTIRDPVAMSKDIAIWRWTVWK